MANHMDRLTSIDAAFLTQEREGSHMHIGGVLVFEGSAPTREELEAHIESRLHLVPRYRQKLSVPRLEMGRPLWVDDPRFNISYHVRHSALPSPGSLEQLRLLVGRVFSQRLDRSKPLWEIWLVEGLERGGAEGGARFALINKVHHALVDGVSGADLTTMMFDLQPERAEQPEVPEAWSPAPEPSEAEIVAKGVRDAVTAPVGVVAGALRYAAAPGRALGRAREAAEGLGEVVWGAVNRAPETPLNVPIGPHRRVAWAHTSVADLKAVKNAFGGTVNDVFLTVVSGALQRWLRGRGRRTEGLELRGAVPVSIRSDDQQGALGNQITVMVAKLPTYADDPLERLRIVSESMRGLKESKQALGAEVIANLEDFAPPTVFARASRLHFSPRLYNLLVTNVPGPQFPLYLLGRKLGQLVPVAFLAPDQALAVAVMSYNGGADISLIGDYDALEDIEQLADYVELEIDGLVSLAKQAQPAGAPVAEPGRMTGSPSD
jgi:WS/DGAT/MGAT family acyltransferase